MTKKLRKEQKQERLITYMWDVSDDRIEEEEKLN